MKREPLVTAAVLTSIIGAVLALLTSFGVDITDKQQAAISGLALVIAPLLVAVLVRPKVTPVEPAAPPADAGHSTIEVIAVSALVSIVVLAVYAAFIR